jgi:hypothetical protein
VLKHNRIILLVLVAVVGFAVWQNYLLRMEHKTEKLHIAHTAHRAAYFLQSTHSAIDSINKNNEWDDMSTRNSFRVWLSYTSESLIHASSTMDDFHSLVSFESRQNMGNILSQFDNWWAEVATILNKSGPLTTEDTELISELSHIISKIDGLNPHKTNDLDGILDAFARLNEEWNNTFKE